MNETQANTNAKGTNMNRIETQNKAWGFYGTLISNTGMSHEQAAAEYDAFARTILVGQYGMAETAAVEFLDAAIGRHVADAMTTWNGFDREALPVWLTKAYATK